MQRSPTMRAMALALAAGLALADPPSWAGLGRSEAPWRDADEYFSSLRAAIVMREIDGLSYEEIATAMECPVGTVRSRIFRAREAIDERLRPLIEGGLGRAGE